jgi:diguanylate cyclase
MEINQEEVAAMQGYPFFPVGLDDEKRIEYLRGLKVLDSNTEVEFEMVCRLAVIHYQMPIVTISLVDSDRQWFKSHLGLSACETSRDVAFCNYTVLSDQVFEVLDATQDARFQNNPLVTGELSIRYYCGFPIVMGGYTVGAFCLISNHPRSAPLTEEDREFGTNCANIVARMLEKRKLMRDSVVSLERFLSAAD